MANTRPCPNCDLPLGPLRHHGRQRDCISAQAARIAELEAALRWRPVTPTEPPCGNKVLVRGMKRLEMAVAYRQQATVPGLAEPVEEWIVETCSDDHNIYPPKEWLPIPGGENDG